MGAASNCPDSVLPPYPSRTVYAACIVHPPPPKVSEASHGCLLCVQSGSVLPRSLATPQPDHTTRRHSSYTSMTLYWWALIHLCFLDDELAFFVLLAASSTRGQQHSDMGLAVRTFAQTLRGTSNPMARCSCCKICQRLSAVQS